MAKLTFKSLRFAKNKNFVKVSLYKLFYFEIPKSELLKIDAKIKINEVLNVNLIF